MFCSFGFFIHIVLVFKGIIDEELVQSVYFQDLKAYELPMIFICFDTKEITKNQIDLNFKLTGHYLNRKTKDLDLANFLTSFIYCNKTHYNEPILSGSKFSNSQLSLTFSYFSNQKCLEIDLKISDHNSNNFLYSSIKFTALVYFKQKIESINLLYREKDSYQF